VKRPLETAENCKTRSLIRKLTGCYPRHAFVYREHERRNNYPEILQANSYIWE